MKKEEFIENVVSDLIKRVMHHRTAKFYPESSWKEARQLDTVETLCIDVDGRAELTSMLDHPKHLIPLRLAAAHGGFQVAVKHLKDVELASAEKMRQDATLFEKGYKFYSALLEIYGEERLRALEFYLKNK